MIAKYYDKTGKLNTKGFELPDSIFAVKVNQSLLSQYVYAYLSNQREANAHTKNRGDVSGGGKKPWNQKGTGRARAGSSRSPLWKGGGVTFGPTNERNFKRPMNKKMIKAAFRSAFSYASNNDFVAVMEKFTMEKASTKAALNLVKEFANDKHVIIIQNGADKNIIAAFRNLPTFKVVNVVELNPYMLLNAKKLVILEDAVEIINKNWAGKKVLLKTKVAKVKKTAVAAEVKEEKAVKPKVVKKTVKKITKKAE
jgi:large subunit ribosomal protein L4